MKILRDGRACGLGDLLQGLCDRAAGVHAGQTALYLAGLSDARGLSLACAVHKLLSSGPDPTELHCRARELGAVDALLSGAVHIDQMERALESLELETVPDRALLIWTMRELHRHGGVPVVMLLDGLALVASLEALKGGAGEVELPGFGRPRPVGQA